MRYRSPRTNLGRRTLHFDSLEDRRLLAADATASLEGEPVEVVETSTGVPVAASEMVAPAWFSSMAVSSGDELEASLTGAGSESGNAEYETEFENGSVEEEFEVEVRGAAPGSMHDVAIDGTIVGQITVDSNGDGRLKLSGNPDDPDEMPLPPNFPMVARDSVVTVGSILSGTLVDEQEGVDDDDHDDDEDEDHDDDEDDADDDDDMDGDEQETELRATLAGSGPEFGDAEYEMSQENGVAEEEFEVEIENASPGSMHDVFVDGVLVGQIVVDVNGEGSLKLSSNPEDADEMPLPAGFPAIGPGLVVSVGSILTGTLA